MRIKFLLSIAVCTGISFQFLFGLNEWQLNQLRTWHAAVFGQMIANNAAYEPVAVYAGDQGGVYVPLELVMLSPVLFGRVELVGGDYQLLCHELSHRQLFSLFLLVGRDYQRTLLGYSYANRVRASQIEAQFVHENDIDPILHFLAEWQFWFFVASINDDLRLD